MWLILNEYYTCYVQDDIPDANSRNSRESSVEDVTDEGSDLDKV